MAEGQTEGGALEKQAPQWVLRRRLAPKRFSVDSTVGPALCARNIDLTWGSSGLDSFCSHNHRTTTPASRARSIATTTTPHRRWRIWAEQGGISTRPAGKKKNIVETSSSSSIMAVTCPRVTPFLPHALRLPSPCHLHPLHTVPQSPSPSANGIAALPAGNKVGEPHPSRRISTSPRVVDRRPTGPTVRVASPSTATSHVPRQHGTW